VVGKYAWHAPWEKLEFGKVRSQWKP